MSKIQPPHVPGFAAQQAQRIVELKAQIDRLKTSLQLAEGERDILKGQNAELSRLIGLARIDCSTYADLLSRAASVSVMGEDLRTDIAAALGNGKEAGNKLCSSVPVAKEAVGE